MTIDDFRQLCRDQELERENRRLRGTIEQARLSSNSGTDAGAEMSNQTDSTKEFENPETLLNGDELHMLIFRHMEQMLDNPDKHGIYPTTDFMVYLKADFQKMLQQAKIDELERVLHAGYDAMSKTHSPDDVLEAAFERVAKLKDAKLEGRE